jgi:hypothetical protein
MNEDKNNKNNMKGNNSSGFAIGMCIGIVAMSEESILRK